MKDGSAKPLADRRFGAFRLALALLVLLQHFFAHLAPADVARAMRPYEIGSVAVLAFFCLSGFVIAEAAERIYQRRPIAFIGNRLLRIAPHFVIAILLTGATYYLLSHFSLLRIGSDEPPLSDAAFSIANILANLLGFLPLGDHLASDNFLVIAWAIRVEMAFYAVVFVWIAAARVLAHRDPGWTFGLVGCTIALALPAPFLLAGGAPQMLQYYPHFLFGCALYFAATRLGAAAFLIGAACVVAIAWQALDHPLTGGTSVRAAPAELALLLTLLSIMSALAFLAITGGRTLDRRLGDLTYPLYLYHHLIMVLALSLLGGPSWTAFAAAVVASVLFAAAAHALVDPAVNRLRDALRGRRMDDAAAPRPERASASALAVHPVA